MMRVDRALCIENAFEEFGFVFLLFGYIVFWRFGFLLLCISILISLHLIRRPIYFVDALNCARR